ncbi:hypothetical protein D3C80_1863210 [compost metagenome]
MAAALPVAGASGRAGAFAAGGKGAHALEGGGQALGAHRLDQVVDRLGLECRQRMRVVGRAEHHGRAWFECGEVAGGFQSVDARHRDVQQHQVGMVFGAGVQRVLAVGRLGHDLDAALLGQ